MSEDLEQFLTPAPGIQCEHPEVLGLARGLAKGAKNDVEAARRLFDFVRDSVRYSLNVPFWELEHYLALNTLARGFGFCVQKSALLCALARALGIPARLGFADIQNHQVRGPLAELIPGGVIHYHCFLEWFVGGRWLKATPSFDRRLCQEMGWRLVEFDPRHNALLPATDLEGRPHISYLRQHGWRLGVPLEECMSQWRTNQDGVILEGWKRLVLDAERR